jgi:hypothetical protein
VLRAAGETETTQENNQDWLQLDGDPGFQLLTEEETAAVIFFFVSTTYITKFLQLFDFYFFFCFRAIFPFINPADLSNRQLIWFSEGFL